MAKPHYYVGDKREQVFHEEDCALLYDIPEGEVIGYVSRGQALAEGMSACPRCVPPPK